MNTLKSASNFKGSAFKEAHVWTFQIVSATLQLAVGARKFEKSYAILPRELLCNIMEGVAGCLIGALRYATFYRSTLYFAFTW